MKIVNFFRELFKELHTGNFTSIPSITFLFNTFMVLTLILFIITMIGMISEKLIHLYTVIYSTI